MRLDVAGRHAFRIHGQDLLFDILTDAGLVLFQKLRFKLTLLMLPFYTSPEVYTIIGMVSLIM